MKAKQKDTNLGLWGRSARQVIMNVVAVASLFLVLNLNAAAFGQSNEIGNVEGYAPKKTISDYEEGGNPSGSD